MNQDLLENLKKKLIDNGTIYISTDVVELYDDMLSVCRDYGMSFIEDDPFWATDYRTHWSMFSEVDQRNQYFITVQFKELS